MDEILKRRLVGAAIVLLGVFLLTLVLPRPGDAPTLEPGAQRVVIDLTHPAPPAAQPAAVTAKPVEPPPAAKEEPAPVETEAASDVPHIETPPVETKPVAAPVADTTPEAAPPPKPAAVVTNAPEPAMGSKPVLRMEQKVNTPIPAPLVKKPAAASKSWYVQTGSYTSIDNARAALDQLKPATGVISPADTASGTLYRVRLGPYAGKDQAKAARDRYAPKANLIED